jgi:succinate-acetate transporter protein
MSNQNLANPAPVGLLGFGMTTILLNLHNAGLYPLDAMILGMGFSLVDLLNLLLAQWNSKKATPLVRLHSCLMVLSGCF